MIHCFLRSVGFRDMKKTTDLYKLLEDVIYYPDISYAEEDPNGNMFVECKKEFGENFGIAVCGDFTEDHEFHMEYYYPYLIGTGVTTEEPIEIERHAEKESYAGICDDLRVGVTMIFYVQNHTEVLRERKICGYYRNGVTATLAGLASKGKILLPIYKTQEQIQQREKQEKARLQLITQAREGDPAAMESLTLQDMDAYSTLSRRIVNEDILSIVESSFMPIGVESDQYTILAEILAFYKTQNSVTNESVWILTLNCNNIIFDICINERDLIGEPAKGRRFRGKIWLQGNINYAG